MDMEYIKKITPNDCPSCDNIVAEESFWFSSDMDDTYQVFCLPCGFEGPHGDTLEEAITLWNKLNPNVVEK